MRTDRQSRGRGTFGYVPRCEAIAVHRLDARIPNDVHRFGSEPGDIGLPRRRVSAVVFRRGELSRIDENRDDDPPCASLHESNQRDCPSWSAPMVGTSAMVASRRRCSSRARRKARTVRAIIGTMTSWFDVPGGFTSGTRSGNNTGEEEASLSSLAMQGPTTLTILSVVSLTYCDFKVFKPRLARVDSPLN